MISKLKEHWVNCDVELFRILLVWLSCEFRGLKIPLLTINDGRLMVGAALVQKHLGLERWVSMRLLFEFCLCIRSGGVCVPQRGRGSTGRPHRTYTGVPLLADPRWPQSCFDWKTEQHKSGSEHKKHLDKELTISHLFWYGCKASIFKTYTFKVQKYLLQVLLKKCHEAILNGSLLLCCRFSPPDQGDLVGPVVEGAREEDLFPVPRPAKHGGPVHSQTFIVCLQVLLPGQVLFLL